MTFRCSDHVRIADDLGYSMSHFTKGCEAIVQYSYFDCFGHGSKTEYCVLLKGSGSCSWYREDQLTLIAQQQNALHVQWIEELPPRLQDRDGFMGGYWKGFEAGLRAAK
jgi:hypothetical protein